MKERILARIAELKRKKEAGWEKAVFVLARRLTAYEERFSEHEYVGTEAVGRNCRRFWGEPDGDDYSEESFPRTRY